jgi:hypothetical protein
MAFLKSGMSYACKADAIKGRRGHKTGPGRGRHHDEKIEDSPPRLLNPAVHESEKRANAAVEDHPMSIRLQRRQLRHLRDRYHSTVGKEFNKVMGSMHPGKHRVGKVRSM